MIALGKCQWRSGGPLLGRTYAFPHHRPRSKRPGLTQRQATIVAAVFFASLTAALALAWWMGRRNRKLPAP